MGIRPADPHPPCIEFEGDFLCTFGDHPPRNERRRISASRIISADKDSEGARCAYLSISRTTSLMMLSIVLGCGTSDARMEERDGDMVAPITRRV